MNTKQALSLGIQDLETKSEKELRAIVNTLVSANNKRLQRMEEAGYYSPTIKRLSTRGTDKNKLIDIATQAKNTLVHETGGLRGTREFYNKFEKNTGINLREMTPEQVKNFFELLKKVDEKKGGRTSKDDSLQRMRSIRKLIRKNPSLNYDELETKYLDKGGVYESEYERQQEQYTSIGDFFPEDLFTQ